ncbi:MAG: tetratricopeptide repeat protein [Chloroflexi bacterium]|nr:tetratricopeptide repeat protein [Chloroflexota bacterium]
MPTLWLLRPQQGHWSANKAAVRLAQAELAGWPDLEREIDPQTVQTAAATLEIVQANFPDNRAVNYRLGLLAAGDEDYAAALPYLEAAYQADPGHRGVIKTLGYSYAWLGQLDEAAPLLSQIPEVPGELETYSWWWGTQDQPARAEFAAAMLTILLQP